MSDIAQNKGITIGGIIVVLLLLVGLGFLIRYFIKIYAEKKGITSEMELGRTDALKEASIGLVVKAIQPDKLAAAKAKMDAFDVKVPADMIKKAKGTFWGGDANAVYTALGMVDTKAELALLNIYFKGLYGIPLLQHIQSFLSAPKMTNVNNIIKTMSDT